MSRGRMTSETFAADPTGKHFHRFISAERTAGTVPLAMLICPLIVAIVKGEVDLLVLVG